MEMLDERILLSEAGGGREGGGGGGGGGGAGGRTGGCRHCSCCCGAAGEHDGKGGGGGGGGGGEVGRWMLQALVAVLLLVTVGLVLLLLVVGLRGAPHWQEKKSPQSHSLAVEKLRDPARPTAMLTAPLIKSPGEFLNWENKLSFAFCRGGLSYSNTDLRVPGKGVYRVFLQITWKCNDSRTIAKVTAKVFKISKSYNEELEVLFMGDTLNCRETGWSKSLYTSALFILEANTALHVDANYRQLIDENESQVFFGAELIEVLPE